MADTSTDDIWGTLGAQPVAAPATNGKKPAGTDDDAIWSTLGTGKATETTPAAEPTIMSSIGTSLLRGAHQGLDVPAEALAGGADWVARQFGYDTTQQAQTRAGDVAFNQPYDVNPANRSIVPTAARVAGNLLTTLPLAVGVGGIVGRAAGIGANALTTGAEGAAPLAGTALRYLPSAVSGAAGSATVAAQTGEPIGPAATAGLALGAALPAAKDVGNALLATRNPNVIAAVTGHDIPLRVGQVAPKGSLTRYLDDITAPEASNAAQRTAVTTDAARSMGVTPEVAKAAGIPVGEVTPATMQVARRLNGSVMNGVEARTTIADEPLKALVTTLQDISASAAKSPSIVGDVLPHIKDVLASVEANDGTIPGKVFRHLTGHGSDLEIATNADNSTVRGFAIRIKEALQDAMHASATPEDAAAYAQARLQYKNMMTLAPLVNKGEPGQISPLLLQGAANRSFKNNAFTGAGQLGSLGDVSQMYLKPPPQSGTEPREFVRELVQGHLLGAAQAAWFKAGAKAAQSVLGQSPVTPFGAVVPGAASPLVPAAVATRNALQR